MFGTSPVRNRGANRVIRCRTQTEQERVQGAQQDHEECCALLSRKTRQRVYLVRSDRESLDVAKMRRMSRAIKVGG